MKARAISLSLLLCANAFVVVAAAAAALPRQDAAAAGVEVLSFSWTRERIRQRPSMLPLASPDELIRQSRSEAQLAAARNAANRGAAGRTETQIKNHEDATAKARQTAPPEDGYRYTVKLRNDGGKTVKSIDWDYLFLDPSTGREVARHQFTSDDTVKPGKTKEVSVLYLTPPVRTVSAKAISKKDTMAFEERVLLVRILYSDGTAWQRP
jgi:hypothetical protein